MAKPGSAAAPRPAGSSLPAERRAALGVAGLLGLGVAAVPLAAPGPQLVPAAVDAGPGWLLGVYGRGLSVGAGAYYAFLWLAFASYVCVLLAAPALPRRLLRGGTLLLLAAFALAPPLLSADVLSYVDYARLGVLHGLDPYANAPLAFPADPAFAHVGWTESPSAYGPLFTLLSYPTAWLGVPAALWALKALAAASVLALALLVARVAPSRGVDPQRALVLVALNPLVLVHVVGGAHNDATTMLVAFAGCAAALALLERSAVFAVAAAIGLKVSAAFVAPFALLGAARRPPPLPTGRSPTIWAYLRPVGWLLVAVVAIVAAGYAAFGWHWLETLALAGENQGRVSNYSLPNLLSELLGVGVGPVRGVALAAFLALVAALLAWVWRGADWIRATGWAALGLLLASAWLLPWYVVWALPFAALSRDRPLQLLVLLLTALQLAARLPL